MEMPNNSSRVRYAVIQLRQSDGRLERFVIRYDDERTLRQFLAKPSIVATGFLSRDEATSKSFTAGIGYRQPRSAVAYHLWMSNVRILSRLQRRIGALKVMNSVVHIAACHSPRNSIPIDTHSATTGTSRAIAASGTNSGPYYVSDRNSPPST